MITWNEIVAADPRMAGVEGEVVSAVLAGANPDRAYADAKPYIGCLVGWRRGRAPTARRPSPLQQRLARVVAIVVVGDDDDRLDSQTAYEQACGHIFEVACRYAERRSA